MLTSCTLASSYEQEQNVAVADGNGRYALVQGYTNPGRLNFIWWPLIFCGPFVWILLFVTHLRLLPDFLGGENLWTPALVCTAIPFFLKKFLTFLSVAAGVSAYCYCQVEYLGIKRNCTFFRLGISEGVCLFVCLFVCFFIKDFASAQKLFS
jgi:hypothetical protein